MIAKNTEAKRQESDRINPETMTEEEIQDWIMLSRSVLIVLKGENNKVYDQVYSEFTNDLMNLKEYQRITEDEMEEILATIKEMCGQKRKK